MEHNTVICVVLVTVSLILLKEIESLKYPRDGVEDRLYFNGRSEDVIRFPQPTNTRADLDRKPVGGNESIKEIPLDVIRRINSLETYDQFFREFIDNSTFEGNDGNDWDIRNRFGVESASGIEIDRKSVVIPKGASCSPELTTVSLRTRDDPTYLYFPSCTRVERCGGCCHGKIYTCQPIQTELINFEVTVAQYTGKLKFSQKNKEIVMIEKHTRCKCDCKVTQKDCNSLQEYRREECKCVCTNIDEQQKCFRDNDTKIWDSNECVCSCRQELECSTGYFFDPSTCSCAEIPTFRRRIGNTMVEVRRRRGEATTRVVNRNKPKPVKPISLNSAILT